MKEATIFKLDFPNDYPLNPPKVVFYTQGERIRFNPNLYTNGKVCLSILGTWPGPSWSSSCSLISVLLSLQTLLNENPIRNEPGWEDISSNDYRCINYNNILSYANFKIAVIKMIEETPSEFSVFKDTMLSKLHQSKQFFIDKFVKNKDSFFISNVLKTEIYSLYLETNIEICINKFNFILNMPINKNNVMIKYKENRIDSSIKETKPTESEKIPEKNKLKLPNKTRQVPNGNANLYEVGFEKVSENNGKTYIIYVTPKNKKRWKIKNH